MKKLLTAVMISAAAFAGITAHAAVGDIVGHVYSTDIRAFVNGVEVPSYSIGGKTAIAVEEALNYKGYLYNNDLRTLKAVSFAPECLSGGYSVSYGSVGEVVDNIYETDIKTYIYDTVVPSYNIGGRTAVAIEDIGADGMFSNLGGKYIWNAAERTINLEFMYDSRVNGQSIDIMCRNHVSMKTANGRAEFIGDYFTAGSTVGDWSELYQGISEGIHTITAAVDGRTEVIGYYFRKKDYVFNYTGEKYVLLPYDADFYYFYTDILEAAAKRVNVLPPTRDEIIDYYKESHIDYIQSRYDTDNYSFLYMTQTTPHGGNGILLYVRSDGSYHEFNTAFKSVSNWGTKWFDKVEIDKTNKKVNIHYDTDYILDLPTGRLTRADGSPICQYPVIPETGRAHYVIYKEGYRNDRVELAVFDSDADTLIWNTEWWCDTAGQALEAKGSYTNEIKYYFDGIKWVEFERGYDRVSNNANEVIDSDLEVRNNGIYTYVFGNKKI